MIALLEQTVAFTPSVECIHLFLRWPAFRRGCRSDVDLAARLSKVCLVRRDRQKPIFRARGGEVGLASSSTSIKSSRITHARDETQGIRQGLDNRSSCMHAGFDNGVRGHLLAPARKDRKSVAMS
jgi:hypothetical protein